MLENLEFGRVLLDGTSEDDEGHQSVALVVRSFGVVAIGREEQVQLAQEASAAVAVEAQQRTPEERLVVEDEAGHAHGGSRPSGMVVHPVECFRLADGQEIRHRAKQRRLDQVAVLPGQRAVDGIVALDRVHQPDGFVQRLPEQPTGCPAPFNRMFAEPGIQLRIRQQKLPGPACVFRIARQLEEDAGVVDGDTVLLVLLVGIPAARILRLRHIRRQSEPGVCLRALALQRPTKPRGFVQRLDDHPCVVGRQQ